MKLAEALIERADLKKAIMQVRSRMATSALVQEGNEPAEDVGKLFSVHNGLMERLEWLIIQINRTNCVTAFDDGTLSDAIARRDCLKSKIKAYQDLYKSSTQRDRFSRNEIKFVRYVDLVKLQGMIDGISKQYRELDTKIQGLNWTIDLIE